MGLTSAESQIHVERCLELTHPCKPSEGFLCLSAPLFLLALLHPLLLFQFLEGRPDEEQRLIAGKALLHGQSRQSGQLLCWLQEIGQAGKNGLCGSKHLLRSALNIR